MSDDIIELNDYRPSEHLFAVMAICLACEHRWIAGVNATESLFMLKCPECEVEDSYGSIIPAEYLRYFTESHDS